MAELRLPEVLTTPIYEPSEAARIVGLRVGRVRRFLLGYGYRHYTKGIQFEMRRQGPVLNRETPGSPDATFLDLIDLWRAKAFIDVGFTPQRVRKAFDEAAQVTGDTHPFARKRFFLTASSDILLDLSQSAGGKDRIPTLVQLLSGGQRVSVDLVAVFLHRVEFDAVTDLVIRWWPLGKEKPIVIDPWRSFGDAIVLDKGVKTAVLHQMYLSERKDATRVARWMHVTVGDVEAAVEFEERKNKGQAAA